MESLVPGSPSLGKYYVITDGSKYNLWRLLDSAVTYMGFPSLFDKAKLPTGLLFAIAKIGKFFGGNFRLTTFTVIMLTIDRWFDISNAEKDLGYKPLVSHDEAWALTLAWYKDHMDWWREKAAGLIKK